MRILVENGHVLTLDGQDHAYEHGDVLIEGDRITAVGEHVEASSVDRVIDASGKLVMPGLNIAHAHSHANIYKGVFGGLPLEVWLMGVGHQPTGWSVPPRLVYLRTILGAAEMILSGATTVQDDSGLMPDKQDTLFQAYRDVGIRATVTAAVHDRALPDRIPFLHESLPQDLQEILYAAPRAIPDHAVEACEQIVQKWHGQDGRLNFALSPSWPQGSSDELLLKLADLSHKYNLPLHTHVLETKVQQVTGNVLYGKSIVRRLHDLGILTPRTTMIHCIWVTDEDIRLMADSQVSVVHNPSSNLVLGSGLMPLRKLLDAGVNVALGVDEGIESRWNPFEMMKTAALIHKTNSPDYRSWPTSGEILRMATYGGARSELLSHEVGSLAKGMKADLILLDLNTVYFTPLGDVKRQLVYSEPGSSVITSIVNGKIVVEDRRILTVDLDTLLDELRSLMTDFWRQNDNEEQREVRRKLCSCVEAVYWRAVKSPTGLNRWTGNECQWIEHARDKT